MPASRSIAPSRPTKLGVQHGVPVLSLTALTPDSPRPCIVRPGEFSAMPDIEANTFSEAIFLAPPAGIEVATPMGAGGPRL
jgi:hypothetical protein